NGEFDALSRHCHALRGSSGNLALVCLAEAFARLEQAAKQEQAPLCNELLIDVTAGMAAVKTAMQEAAPELPERHESSGGSSYDNLSSLIEQLIGLAATNEFDEAILSKLN